MCPKISSKSSNFITVGGIPHDSTEIRQSTGFEFQDHKGFIRNWKWCLRLSVKNVFLIKGQGTIELFDTMISEALLLTAWRDQVKR